VAVVKVTRKHQVTLPASVREGIRVGDEVEVLRVGEEILIRPSKKKIAEEGLWGLGQELWQDIEATEYVSSIRHEWEARERKWRNLKRK